MTSTAPLQLHSCPSLKIFMDCWVNHCTSVCPYVYACISLCTPVCPYVRVPYARMYVCIPVCTCVCTYVLVYDRTSIYPYVRMYVSCFFIGLNDDDRCTFHTGDGIGGSEIKVGNEKGSSCIDICLERKKTDETINGVTVFTDTSKGGCWCERNMREEIQLPNTCLVSLEIQVSHIT